MTGGGKLAATEPTLETVDEERIADGTGFVTLAPLELLVPGPVVSKI